MKKMKRRKEEEEEEIMWGLLAVAGQPLSSKTTSSPVNYRVRYGDSNIETNHI